LLPGYPHLITIIYPHTDEDDLLQIRQEFHKRLFLPMDRPLLRIGNAFNFQEITTAPTERILDVHTKLKLHSQISGGRQYLMEGAYYYYHYMQDNLNDNGWGCAYRSMQTICSWFQLQRYTNRAVPSHKEIQKMLVDMGDKPRSFIGSSQWIGAIEISMCLRELFGISSNIMHMSSGAEFPSKAKDLAHHFTTQGTPVMIGGGVLAYTLLGIDLNEQGECRFLILDPHYTGAEDLKTIKGWCGWKQASLFRNDSFYNLCLPQRPKQI